MATNNAINNSSKVTKYTSSDTWNKDSRTKFIEVFGWSSGGNGASGRKGSNTAAGGGGGGAGGVAFYFRAPAQSFGNSETVTIGATIPGASAQASDATNGVNGSAVNPSTFGNITTQAPTASSGGITTGAAGGGGARVSFIHFVSVVSATGGGTGQNTVGLAPANYGSTTNTFLNCGGGGGGAGYDTGTVRVGGNGSSALKIDGSTVLVAGGTGGSESISINGGAGNPTPSSGGIMTGGSGGGGGGGPSAGTVAGIGGNGGTPGGGGGGGSGGITTVASSGAGGDGARGEIWVVEYF